MTTSINSVSDAGPLKGLTPPMPGHVVSVSCNVLMALSLMADYLNSTYNLQMADTALEAAITNQETQLVQQFEQQMIAAGNPASPYGTGGLLWQIEHLTADNCPGGKDYFTTYMQTLTTEYSAANAQNQADVKTMDSNNSTAQNILNQNSQSQPGIIQAMQALNTNGANLVRILQG